MRFSDTIDHAFGNLKRQRLRTALTTTGVAIGVWTTAIMMAFPAGVREILRSKLDKQDMVVTMTVMGRKMRVPTSVEDFQAMQKAQHDQKPVPLDDALVDELKTIPGVRAVYPDLTTPITLEVNDHVENMYLVEGLPWSAISQTHTEALLSGSYWKDGVDDAVCVLPSGMLATFGIKNAKDAVGQRVVLSRMQDFFRYRPDPPMDVKLEPGQVRKALRPSNLDGRELEVIGVYDSDQFGIMSDRKVQMPLAQAQTAQTKLGGFRKPKEGKYNQLVLKCNDRHDVEAVRAELDRRGLGTLMTTDFLSLLNVIFYAIEAGLGTFGAIALFVSLFGIANTMVMAVLERTREIGIMKALGGRDRDVWWTFVFEAGGIGLLAGVLGIAVALVSCKVLNLIATYALKDAGARALEIFAISPLLALSLIGFATVVSAFAGLYPAQRAARLDPVEALRRE